MSPKGTLATVSVLASASGVRIDCDACGDHAASPDVTLEQLRRATGFVRVDDRDFCPRCAALPQRTRRPYVAARGAP